jgi:hypothetical protein
LSVACYWSSLSSLNNADELIESARVNVGHAVMACPEILAKLAEDDLLDPDSRQGVEAAE